MFRVNGALDEFETGFYEREALSVDAPLDGPAIVLQRDSTTVVPPGARLMADSGGNLIITVASATARGRGDDA